MEQETRKFIKIPYPPARDCQLKIVVPMCKLVIAPGIGTAWVTGWYNDPYVVIPLNVEQSKNTVQLSAVGAFAYRTPRKRLPDMQISLGRSQAFSLYIYCGDLDNLLDLGGTPLNKLEVQLGGGSQVIDFSCPNPQSMKKMKIRMDNGHVRVENIANANADEIHLNGACTCQVNLGTALKKNTSLWFGSEVIKAEVVLPAATAVRMKSVAAPVCSRTDDFSFENKTYLNEVAREDPGILLNIHFAGSAHPLKLSYV